MRTRLLKVDPEHPDPAAIHAAAALLRRGGLVAFPTETVYGLGANLHDPQAIQELYQVKERPFGKQVTLHIADFKEVESSGVIVSSVAIKFMSHFWPGPLTAVLRHSDGSTHAFRMPRHPVALALIREAQVPVVAPSANLSGNPAPRTAEEVMRDLADKIDLVLDAGSTLLGCESTVVDFTRDRPMILRPGVLAKEIEQMISETAAA